ncbi:hypothetical protein E1264_11755 [Actinomadura sp. KC216]|uniref:hypothetical protein n=1 Tax=Actinomadura sp. KC216 TaxID=2530370 RepID=UPI001043647A|nr:hypothetical protein [Actinomadura sp. KC216]TDB88350.1 hypothetical protein E1264_11755 [Actinomadura sp. KC216]
MSLDERITGKDAPPPAPRPRQVPREAVPVAGHTALTVQPGQTLIVTLPEALSAEHTASVGKELQERLPGVEVLVLAGVQQIAVYDPGTEVQ